MNRTRMVDARLPDGGRVNVVIEPLSIDGPVVSIESFAAIRCAPPTCSPMAPWTRKSARCWMRPLRRAATSWSQAGTSSGKTSLLNALAFFIPKHERVVTIEDTAELSLNHPHVVRLESRPGGFDGAGTVSIRDLLRNTLRMRPDRIIVGEVRGGEVLEMLAGDEHWPRRFHGHRAREFRARMPVPAGDAGGVRRLPGNGVEPAVGRSRMPSTSSCRSGGFRTGRRRIISVTEVNGAVRRISSPPRSCIATSRSSWTMAKSRITGYRLASTRVRRSLRSIVKRSAARRATASGAPAVVASGAPEASMSSGLPSYACWH